MRVLHIVSSLDSVYGGQPEAVKQLIMALADLGHTSEIITLDNYMFSFPKDQNIIIHTLGPSLGKYNLNFKLIPWLSKNARNFDAVICHGIWQFQSLATWLASGAGQYSFFVYVHGALDPWFKYTYPIKHLKKWAYWPWAEYNVLKYAAGVLFTSEGEKLEAPKSFCLYKANAFVVKSGIQTPEGNAVQQRELFLSKFPGLNSKKILLFLGRIHPIKGCDNLVKAFANIAVNHPNLQLVVAGPDVIGWTSTLMDLAKTMGINDQITWAGMLEGGLKWGALHMAACLVLPSHTENFGIVVAEALSCGTPVIITNKVNIWSDIQKENAGYVCEDTLDGLNHSLKLWMDQDILEIETMRQNAQRCFNKHFDIHKNAEELVKTIQETLKK
jgi:glycosyltransferase involved in cell wall biosynthesis